MAYIKRLIIKGLHSGMAAQIQQLLIFSNC